MTAKQSLRTGHAIIPPHDLILKNLLVQAQLCREPLQLRVLLLQLPEPLGLIHAKTAILLAPAVVGLLYDRCLSAGLGD